MKLEIRHLTQYTYSRPVFMEPHTFRVCPRSDGYQRLLAFELLIRPEPAGISYCLDAEGNQTAVVWFNGTHTGLSIMARAEVESIRSNPFDYLLDFQRTTLPMKYAEEDEKLLGPALAHHVADTAVQSFVDQLLTASGRHVTHFLDLLNRKIHTLCAVAPRASGGPKPAAQTLADRQGACRDLAVLFMESCRLAGLACRFVSGYQYADNGQTHELHAWAEVFLPGAGWRGYDPSQGLAVTDTHIATAAAISPDHASPVLGTLRGKVETAMQAMIQIRPG